MVYEWVAVNYTVRWLYCDRSILHVSVANATYQHFVCYQYVLYIELFCIDFFRWLESPIWECKQSSTAIQLACQLYLFWATMFALLQTIFLKILGTSKVRQLTVSGPVAYIIYTVGYTRHKTSYMNASRLNLTKCVTQRPLFFYRGWFS